MRQPVLKGSRRLERGSKLVQAFTEGRAKLIEFLVKCLQRCELSQDSSKLILEIAHRLEHLGQVLDPHLELAKGLEHIRKLRKLVHRFQNNRDSSELLLQWPDLLKNSRYCRTGLKRILLI